MGKLHISTEVQLVHEHWDGEQYGDWSEEHAFRGSKVSLENKGGQIGWVTDEIDTSFDAKVGDWVYPVIVIYSTGNTFGRSDGNVVVAGIYNSPEKAQEVKQTILRDSTQNPHGFGYLEIPGEPQIYPGTWKGYFEHLEDVRIEMEVVRP
jgi:hypothetical protein